MGPQVLVLNDEKMSELGLLKQKIVVGFTNTQINPFYNHCFEKDIVLLHYV